MQAKLIVKFENLSDPGFLALSGSIIMSLQGNPHFPEPWSALVPSLAAIGEAHKLYEDSYNTSLSGDHQKIALREAARRTLAGQLKQLAPYLELVAKGDVDALGTAGYALRRDIVFGNDDPLPAPHNVRVIQGLVSGSVILRGSKVVGAHSYLLQATRGDPLVDSAWEQITISTGIRHTDIKDLIPKETYWFRICAIGAHGNGLWSDPICITVV